MRAVIYGRVSKKDKQEVTNQINELTTFVSRSNYKLVEIIIDKESGGNPNRVGFRKIFDLARQKKFDVLVFWSMDRFSREGAKQSINYLSELEGYGVAFQSYTEKYIDSTGIFKEVIIALLSTLAKQERVRISERVRAGLKVARSRGKKLGRRPIDRSKIERIKELRKEGLSYRMIEKQLGVSYRTVGNYLKK